jgi:hypothetical protein
MQLGGQQDISLGGHLRWGREGRLDHNPPPCPVFPPATAHDEREYGRHFRALAAAEDSTRHVHFRVTRRMPGLGYLRHADLPDVDDISASGTSYR